MKIEIDYKELRAILRNINTTAAELREIKCLFAQLNKHLVRKTVADAMKDFEQFKNGVDLED